MRNTARKAPGHISDLPPLPSRVVSLDGQLVDTSAACWRHRSSPDGGKRKKARTIENDFRMFSPFPGLAGLYRAISIRMERRDGGIARAFLAYGVEHTADKGNDFSRLRTFYRWGVARQHCDFDPDLFRILRTITAVGNSKRHNVRFRHLVKGPFSPDELLLIGRAVSEGRGADRDRAIVMLHLELGHNPNASVRLRNKDFVRYETDSGVAYQLEAPRVKKRTSRRETKGNNILDIPENPAHT